MAWRGAYNRVKVSEELLFFKGLPYNAGEEIYLRVQRHVHLHGSCTVKVHRQVHVCMCTHAQTCACVHKMVRVIKQGSLTKK